MSECICYDPDHISNPKCPTCSRLTPHSTKHTPLGGLESRGPNAHSRECGFTNGLEWAINTLLQEMK